MPIGVGDGKPQGKSGGSLTAAQKAGISVGVIGLAALTVGAIALFRLYRRRQRSPYRRSDSTEALNRRDTWGYRVDKVDKGGSSGGNSWLARPNHPVPPLPPPSDSLAPPGRYVPTSWRPSAIGLAVSLGHHATQTTTTPPRSTPTRPLSRLLPAKPAMALGATKKPSYPDESLCPQVRLVQASPPHARSGPRPPAPPKLHIPEPRDGGGSGRHAVAEPASHRGPLGRHDSTMTEFEEDGRATSQSPEGQIWRPPSTSATPHSAATYYVADKHGNWVLGDPKRVSHVAEIGIVTPVTPVTAATPRPGVASAVVLPTSQRALKVESRSPLLTAEQPQPDGAATARTLTTTTLAPGARLAEPWSSAAALTSPELRQRAFPPRPLFSSARLSQSRRPRVASADSGVTTIATLSDDDYEYDYDYYDHNDDDDDDGPVQHPVSPLSPVTESPRSGPAARPSPVTYPRIGGRRLSTRAPAGARPLVPGPFSSHHQSRHQHAAGPRPPWQQQQQDTMPRRGQGGGDDSYNEEAVGPLVPGSSSTLRLVEPSPSPPDGSSDRGHLPSASRLPSLRHASSHPVEQQQQQRHASSYPAEQQRQPVHPPQSWTPRLPAHYHPHARPQPAPSRQPVTPWLPPPRGHQVHHDSYYHHRYDDYDQYQYQYQHQHRHQHPHPHPHHHARQHSLPNPPSLIAKRLGPARAARMSITTDPLHRPPPPRPANHHQHQQRQQHRQPTAAAAASTAAATGNNRPWRRQSTSGPLYLSPELVTPCPLPGHDDDGDGAAAVPSWVPRLTPTRGGEHLYFNVR